MKPEADNSALLQDVYKHLYGLSHAKEMGYERRGKARIRERTSNEYQLLFACLLSLKLLERYRNKAITCMLLEQSSSVE
jgi:hypothetical protein